MSELTARRSRENGWVALASASQSMRLSRIQSEAQITVYLQPRQCGLCTSTQIQTLRRTCCISENKLSECSLRARAGYEWLYLDNNVFGYGYLNQTLMYRNSLCIESGDLTCHKLEDPSAACSHRDPRRARGREGAASGLFLERKDYEAVRGLNAISDATTESLLKPGQLSCDRARCKSKGGVDHLVSRAMLR